LTFPLCLWMFAVRPTKLRALLLAFGGIFIAGYWIAFPLGLAMNGARYLYPFMPIFVFGLACGLASRRKWQRVLAIASIALCIAFIRVQTAFPLTDYRTFAFGFRESLMDTVGWMNANLPKNSVVMVHDAGYAAYAGQFRLIDLVGLKTPEAAAIHHRLTYPSAGELRPEAVAKIADEFEPHYAVFVQRWENWLHVADGLRANGWTVRTIYHSKVPADFGDWDSLQYNVYELTPPAAAKSE
jgi:hypothetical protein